MDFLAPAPAKTLISEVYANINAPAHAGQTATAYTEVDARDQGTDRQPVADLLHSVYLVGGNHEEAALSHS